ncbi:hypothetical protein [Mycolicibacterium brumae]|uniref:Uncharacterized protein n=1 Tax=Mycolicibacterium brumae TaxID=85968 RepID=A0A2G5PEX6_9MYCO|nr:hypothetical protein [Mycolicibacterium brumae]MCV7192673.1 hypothetical protein [Mycolicibacterium brumae]PIB76583.1 hypothetical protein CQY22_005610 [Mycolicibacterium brumae]RWA23257.1 hypothetical protein MBRU_00125 [Mycolicibacterium brumae DSM 44177]UWW08813.1 hypothetical protein L2Z93_001882 [Mycolicibacterium brumae]
MDNYEFITYEEWGRKFFEVAVTEERIADSFAAIAGDAFTLGPMAQGPGKLAKVTANVNIGQPKATRHLGEAITFTIRIPLDIELLVDLRLDKQRFNVDGEVLVRAVARAAEPLLLILDVAKPRPSDISVHVSSKSLRGEIVRIIGGVDEEIRRFTAAHVCDQIDSPESKKAQVIHVGDMIDETWQGI